MDTGCYWKYKKLWKHDSTVPYKRANKCVCMTFFDFVTNVCVRILIASNNLQEFDEFFHIYLRFTLPFQRQTFCLNAFKKTVNPCRKQSNGFQPNTFCQGQWQNIWRVLINWRNKHGYKTLQLTDCMPILEVSPNV